MARLSFLDVDNRLAALSAGSPLRSAKGETKLKARGFRSRIHRRGSGINHPLSQSQQQANRRKSKVRGRVEQIFSAQENTRGGGVVRTIGVVTGAHQTIPSVVVPGRVAAARGWRPTRDPKEPSGIQRPLRLRYITTKNRRATRQEPLRLKKPWCSRRPLTVKTTDAPLCHAKWLPQEELFEQQLSHLKLNGEHFIALMSSEIEDNCWRNRQPRRTFCANSGCAVDLLVRKLWNWAADFLLPDHFRNEP
jgi:hypothetical protein